MGKIKKGWYERKEIKRVTLDFVKTNCKLTEREEELLQIISDRKLVRRDMLEVISPSYRYLGENRTLIINRSINKMFKSMVVDKVHEPQEFMKGNKPATVALDKAGAITLGVPFKQRIRHHMSVVRGDEYVTRSLPANYRHINGVNQLEVDTILFCEDNDSKIIQWVHEKPMELFWGQEKVLVIPDIIMELKLADKALFAFVEYDTGSESKREKEPPIIRDKIIKYRKYMLSGLWEDDYPQFPMLLLVTEDSNRIDFFNKKCKESGLLGMGVYYKNYSKFLEQLYNIM